MIVRNLRTENRLSYDWKTCIKKYTPKIKYCYMDTVEIWWKGIKSLPSWKYRELNQTCGKERRKDNFK